MPRCAAIDIGTNSTKITIADVGDGTISKIIAERSKVTRLGKGVDKTRRFEDAAIEATLQSIREFSEEARSLGAERIVAGGTSAMRDAVNGDEFRRLASEITGGEIEVVTGDREAELTFLGAMSDAEVAGEGAVLAFDVGGGSTELIVGQGAPLLEIEHSQSLDIGAVRLTERFLASEQPTPEELGRADAAAEEQLDRFDLSGGVQRIVGIGGTVVNVASMLQAERQAGHFESRGVEVQGAIVSADELDALIQRLAALTLEHRRAVPGLDPSRADVIVAGMLIIRRILARCALDQLTVSTRGVRHGLLLEMAS